MSEAPPKRSKRPWVLAAAFVCLALAAYVNLYLTMVSADVVRKLDHETKRWSLIRKPIFRWGGAEVHDQEMWGRIFTPALAVDRVVRSAKWGPPEALSNINAPNSAERAAGTT